MSVNIDGIVRRYLVENGYDGLCNPEAECGCDLEDLMACGEPNGEDCRAAWRHDCAGCMDGPNHNNDCPLSFDGYDYMMSTEAGFCHPVPAGGDGE